MESRHIQEQETPDHHRINAAGSNSHPQRAPCPNHFQDSTTARAVLATILEIISVSGNDLNLAYSNSDRRTKCPMLKCFHVSETPMEQIFHVISCAEASKGEIQCWTCHKCHEFKKWHAMCNTLKSPVELLRRLSSRKHGRNASGGEPSATKKGKVAMNDDFALPSRKESHGVEGMWVPEMEDPTSLLLYEVSSTPDAALELDAEVNNIPLTMPPREFQTAKPLPTPPSTRDNSWSENSRNLVAYGDEKVVKHAPEQPPPYIVSPQTTVDDYQLQGNVSDSLRLGIPPVQYIHESNFIESPEDMEADETLWGSPAVFGNAQDAHTNLQFPPTTTNATASAQYASPSEKSASIFSSSFPASRMRYPSTQKKNTWPMQLDCSDDIPGPPPFEHQQRHTLDDVPDFTGQHFPAATASQQDIGARLSVQRQASFDTGTQDSITVGTPSQEFQTGGRREDKRQHQHPARRGAGEQQQTAAQDQSHRQYEECGRCGQRFRGIPKNRMQHLKRHVASKHGDVRFRCSHQNCRRSYNRVDNLHDHERKYHRVLRHQQQSQGGTAAAGGGGGGWSSSETVAELSAGDVEIPERPLAAAGAEGRSTGGGSAGHHHHRRRQDPGAIEAHFAVYGYPISTEEGEGIWHHHDAGIGDDLRDMGGRRRRRPTEMMIDADEWNVLMAGVSGGQHDYVEQAEVEAGPPDVGHHELAPRPLDLPAVSWRA